MIEVVLKGVDMGIKNLDLLLVCIAIASDRLHIVIQPLGDMWRVGVLPTLSHIIPTIPMQPTSLEIAFSYILGISVWRKNIVSFRSFQVVVGLSHAVFDVRPAPLDRLFGFLLQQMRSLSEKPIEGRWRFGARVLGGFRLGWGPRVFLLY